MHPYRTLTVFVVVLAGTVVAVSGCTQQSPASGPLQQAPKVGLVEVTFDGVGTQALHASATSLPQQGVAGQSLTYQNEANVDFTTISDTIVDVDTNSDGIRDTRYIRFTGKLVNHTGASLVNLTMLGVDAPGYGTLYGTDVLSATVGSGGPAPESLVRAIRPTTGFGVVNGELTVDWPEADFVVFHENELSNLLTAIQSTHTGVDSVFPYGYTVSRYSYGTSGTYWYWRTLKDGDTGVVTIEVRVPLQSSRADDLLSFKLLYALATDTISRTAQAPDQLLGASGYAEPLWYAEEQACNLDVTYATSDRAVFTIGYTGTSSITCDATPQYTLDSVSSIRIAGTGPSDPYYLTYP